MQLLLPLGERGSVSVELAVLAPAVLLLLSFAIWAGRVQVADNGVQEAARAAARLDVLLEQELRVDAQIRAPGEGVDHRLLRSGRDRAVRPQLEGQPPVAHPRSG